jgi:hypothetical protein
MPDAWSRPSGWSPLGTLVLKSESEQAQIVQLAGQDEGRAIRSCMVELPAKTRVEVQSGLYSLNYLHLQSSPAARIGVYCPLRQETHIIGALDWGNIWVYGLDILLAGYMPYEEFSRRAGFIPAGTAISQHVYAHLKSLSVPVADLRPLSELFESVRTWST